MKGNHYILLHQPGKRDVFLLDNTLKNKSLKYGRTYSMSSALVSGKEWFAAISKMLFTKTLGLKIMFQKIYSKKRYTLLSEAGDHFFGSFPEKLR